MDHSLTYTKSLRCAAGVESIWDALVNPEKIKEYLFGTEAISDWKVGSPLFFQGEWEGKAYKDKATILEFEVNRRFSYNYWSGFSGLEDIPENYSTVVFELISEEDETTLILNQTGFKNEEALKHTEANWSMVLEKIKILAERK